MNELRKKERELFQESWILKNISFELTEKGNPRKNFEKSREIQKRQNEVYKKQQFYKKLLKEMEK